MVLELVLPLDDSTHELSQHSHTDAGARCLEKIIREEKAQMLSRLTNKSADWLISSRDGCSSFELNYFFPESH